MIKALIFLIVYFCIFLTAAVLARFIGYLSQPQRVLRYRVANRQKLTAYRDPKSLLRLENALKDD